MHWPGLVKCSSLFITVFLMCPRRIRPYKQGYFHAVRRSNDVIDANNTSESIAVNDEEFLSAKLPDYEPGFDLTDDEIRKFKLWPKGIIPYFIDVISFSDKVLRDKIRLFLNTVNTQTRISFLELPSPPKDEKSRWVFFANRRAQLGCSDHSILNFTNEGVQHVTLGYDCLFTGGELAEAVLAIAGVPPQHNAPDRDGYIKIVEENIIPEKRYLFKKLNDDEWLFHGVAYDLTSAGHYHHHKYSINGKATIEFVIDPFLKLSVGLLHGLGEGHSFTRSDIKKLRMLYNYIVKKKETKVPECEKLFRKGYNFDEEVLKRPDIKPRKKPSKYLGEREAVTESIYDEDGEDDDDDEESDNDQNKEDNDKKDAEDEDANENDDETATRKMDLKSHPKNPKHNLHKIDPLLYLSDYQTDEGRRKASEKKSILKTENISSTTFS